MKHLIYSLLQWIQLAAFICPLVLIYKSRTRDHLLWLFAAYLQVNFLFAAFECVLSKYDFSPAVTEQYNIMVNILNMFDGVWCIFIVHYGATGAKLKKTAGNAAMVLFIIECIHALLVGVDVQHAALAFVPGCSIVAAPLPTELVIDRLLFEVRQQEQRRRQMPEVEPDRLHAWVVILGPRAAQSQRWQVLIRIVITLHGQPDLLQVVGALHPAPRLARGLDRGQKERN